MPCMCTLTSIYKNYSFGEVRLAVLQFATRSGYCYTVHSPFDRPIDPRVVLAVHQSPSPNHAFPYHRPPRASPPSRPLPSWRCLSPSPPLSRPPAPLRRRPTPPTLPSTSPHRRHQSLSSSPSCLAYTARRRRRHDSIRERKRRERGGVRRLPAGRSGGTGGAGRFPRPDPAVAAASLGGSDGDNGAGGFPRPDPPAATASRGGSDDDDGGGGSHGGSGGTEMVVPASRKSPAQHRHCRPKA
uniref:Uncharacterized protein n=1 Tax=Oryza meridionalis TaxID=40149 RepID=A0A0E0EBJ1_9ORYZ